MSIPCIAALDVGTTAVKVCLFNEQMELLESALTEYELAFPSADRVEVTENIYRGAISGSFRKLLSSGLYNVKAIGITTQGETLTAIGKDGRLLMNFIVWLDHRAEEQAQRLKSQLSDEDFYRITGLPSLDGALPMCKLMWIADYMPKLYDEAEKFLLLEDYLLYRLTGTIVSEKSLQTSTGWFSLREDGYSQRLLALSGLSAEKLPELAEPGTKIGELLPDPAKELGLPEGIPVICGAMDQTAAAYASGCCGDGIVTETTGTALTMAVCTEHPVFEGNPVTIYRHAEPGKYLYLPIGNTGGRALSWLREHFFKGFSYDSMTELAGKIPAGSDGLVFLPFLSGIVDPDNIPDGKACFYGITLTTGSEHFIRAVMEGVACELCDFIRLLEQKGCRIETVLSLGGGANSPLWEQIKANICGKTFAVPDCSEAAACGAALLAARGAGLNWGACRNARIRKSYSPFENEFFVYQRYQKVYAAVLPLEQGE